jgi:predicted ribonuclease YlaK
LLNLLDKAFNEEFVISSKTLQEIESIKSSGTKSEDVKFKARKLSHLLDENDKYNVSIVTNDIFDVIKSFNLDVSPDNIIIATAYLWNKDKEQIIFVSDDINCKCIAKEIFGLKVKGINDLDIKNTEEYAGYKEVILSDDEMNYFYNNIDKNLYNSLLNEYLIIKNSKNEVTDRRRWDGEKYTTLSYKQINSDFSGRIKPRNEQQVIAFDMLQNKNETIKVLTGKYGTGKDYLMISNALELIKQGKYDKILWVRNTIEVKNTKSIGFLPGSMHDKLLPFAMIMADHLGGKDGLDMFMMQGKIEIEHLGFIRGRDYKNTIIICSEAENMTKEHVQLLIGRIGEGSALWLNGDFKQTDTYIFESNNGLLETVNKLKGHEKFGYVKLIKTERSETAALADLLD